MNIKSTVLTLVILFLKVGLIAQIESIHLSGKIVDADSQQPLGFSNILQKNTSRGTVSNEEGLFQLFIPNPKPTDSIQVSFIGYETLLLSLSECQKEKLVIPLKPSSATLSEVVVTSFSTLDLIKKAINKIPENYGDAHTHTSFYRMTTKNDQHYMHLSEVIMEQYHPGYHAIFQPAAN